MPSLLILASLLKLVSLRTLKKETSLGNAPIEQASRIEVSIRLYCQKLSLRFSRMKTESEFDYISQLIYSVKKITNSASIDKERAGDGAG
jgi:hypothetical protein